MSKTLSVFFNEERTGYLRQDDAGNLSFAYDATWLSSPAAIPISVSMPLKNEVYGDQITRPFFSGLLPDESARRRLAEALGLSSNNPFGLLEIVGGDCAGALSFYPENVRPSSIDRTAPLKLSEEKLITILKELRTRPLLGGEEGVRLSLAGVQDKLAVCQVGSAIALPQNGAPSTHILKPFIRELEDSVENEFFCMRLAARLKLPVPSVAMQTAGDIPFLLVERYDRKYDEEGYIKRLHQEDFCQALSVPPELKYEIEGGPGIERSLELIANNAERPAADRLAFVHMLIFHYLIGNADAHAKNFSLLYKGRNPHLAPVYDALSTAVYPRLVKNMAMSIGHRSVPDTINLEQWLTLAPKGAAARRLLINDLSDMAERAKTEAQALMLELKDQKVRSEIIESIIKVIKTRAAHLLDIVANV